MGKTKKEKRIELRVTEEAKNMIEQAAASAGLTTSAYISSVVLKQAKLDLSSEAIVLTREERDRLIENLNSNPEPNRSLKRLLK